MSTQIFPTENGKVFNITLDPGYCFAMSLDMAKVILTHISIGKPKKLPYKDELTTSKWAIIQSAYEINNYNSDVTLIEAQSLKITDNIKETKFNKDFAIVARVITDQMGTNIFGISNDVESHAMLWHRDDENEIYFFLDPNEGLYKCDDANDGKSFIQSIISSSYDDLNKYYDSYTVALI